MRIAFGFVLSIIILIVAVFANFEPTTEFPTRQSIIDHTLMIADENMKLEERFDYIKDMNFDSNNTMLGNSIYNFFIGIKYDARALFYFSGWVAEQYPWLIQNWQLLFLLVILILIAPVMFIIILGIILLIKDRVFERKKEKNYGVWENDKNKK